MSPRCAQRPAARGFTLVEVIIAITLLGIIGAIIAVFIRAPIQSYKDSRSRAEVTDLADLALRRIARDVRLALPNSIRVNAAGTTLEFLQTRTGGRYLALEDASPSGSPLDFSNAANVTFSVVGPLDAAGRTAIQTGPAAIGTDLLVVNNQGEEADQVPANAYALTGTNRNIAYIRAVDLATTPSMPTITLWDNPFATQSPSMPSEAARFQVVSGPVTYHCGAAPTGIASAVYRQWNYGIALAQAVPPVVPFPRSAVATGAQSQVLIDSVQSCSFTYSTNGSGKFGLLVLSLTLRTPDDAGYVKLVHQIHVDNTP